MKSPYSDPNLSLRARGLFAYYVEVGRVLSAEEMSASVPEGRDAIRNAMAELKLHRYIKAVRHQDNSGQWRTNLKFTDDGLSGVLYMDRGIVTNTNTSDMSTSDTGIDTVTNVTVSIGAAPQTEKGIEMGWSMFEDSTDPKSKKKVLDTEDDSGAIGKVNTLKVGGARPKKTKVELAARNRVNIAEEDWTTGDLVAEFYDLYMDTCGGKAAPNQINGQHLITWINKRVGEGVQRIYILKGIRMFFGDARVIADPGVGLPMYQRFMSYYGTIHGLVSRVDEPTGLDEDTLAHQEKMLKLLES
jgi:hypothetical protein